MIDVSITIRISFGKVVARVTVEGIIKVKVEKFVTCPGAEMFTWKKHKEETRLKKAIVGI